MPYHIPHKDHSAFAIERRQMPQINSVDDLQAWLSQTGIHATEEQCHPVSLKPSQNDFDVDKISDLMKTGKFDKPVIVSSDDHVIDGHHNWIAQTNLNKQMINILPSNNKKI